MAHIEKRGPKRWKARYRGPDGRERSQTFERKVDAENWLTGVEGDKLRQAWIDPSLAKTSFEDWTARWWEITVTLKPKTRSGYEGLLRTLILPRFGASALSLIRPVDVQEWVAQLVARGLSPSRIRQAYYLLGAIMKAAVESGYLVKPPTVGVKLPRMVHREMRFLTAQQVNALAHAMPEPYPTLVYVLAYGGIRWGEMAALRRSRCDLLRSRIRVVESLADVEGRLHFGPTKTYAVRAVALPTFLRDRLAEHLAHYVADDALALVFTAPNGSPLRNSSFHKRFWTPAVKAAGFRGLRPHDLRHTAAALLIAQGAHPKAMQSHLGHSSISVTLDRYGHLFADDMERLADGLERTYRDALAAPPRPGRGLEVVEIPRATSESRL